MLLRRFPRAQVDWVALRVCTGGSIVALADVAVNSCLQDGLAPNFDDPADPLAAAIRRRKNPPPTPPHEGGTPGNIAADPPAVPMLGSASSAGKKGVEGVPPLDLSSIPQEAAAAKPTAEVRARPPFLFDQQSGDQRIDSDGMGAVHLGILVGSLRTQRPFGAFLSRPSARSRTPFRRRSFGPFQSKAAADSFARALCAQSVGAVLIGVGWL
jgi:hypothetical protein